MTPEERFKLCQLRAERIVSAYRAECPSGFDPVGSYAAIVVALGSVVAGGISAYSSNSAGKAGSKAAGEAAKKLQGAAGQAQKIVGEGADKAIQTLDPYKAKLENVSELLMKVVKGNRENLLPEGKKLAQSVNFFNQNELDRMLGKALPGVKDMVQLASNNTLSMLRGEIPSDRAAALRRASAQQATQGGFGNSESSRALEARDLGLDSLALMQEGSNSAQRWIQTARTQLMPALFDPSSFFDTPQLELQSILGGADIAAKQAAILSGSANSQADILLRGAGAATSAQLQGAEAAIKGQTAAAANIASGVTGVAGAVGSYYQGQSLNTAYSPGTTGGYGSLADASKAAPYAGSTSMVKGVGYVPRATGIY